LKYAPISIVIPTWNGKKLLKRYLPAVVRSAQAYRAETEIVVVDDGSIDGTVSYLKKNYPNINIISRDKNGGFASACNLGVAKCKHEIVVLLNNDMWIEEGFFKPLSKHFKDPNVFGLAVATPRLTNEPFSNQNTIRFGLKLKYGMIECPLFELVDERGLQEASHTFKLSGGASVIDKEKFLEINGFDELFSPFYWEDVDLSYRIWKRKWLIIYEPKSVARHQVHGTINSKYFEPNFIKKVSERNRYILIWKNISDYYIIFKHIVFIPIRMCAAVFRGQLLVSVNALTEALGMLPLILKKRKNQKEYRFVSDKEIFHKFDLKQDT